MYANPTDAAANSNELDEFNEQDNSHTWHSPVEI
jgi:hypothetical protein